MADSFPIRELSANFKSWTVKARVTQKTDLRSFNKNGRDNAVFSCTLIDKDDGQIRAQFWGEGAKTFHPKLDEGKVYTFSSGSVRVANARYNTTSHSYEIHFDDKAVINPCADDSRISLMKYNWVPIKDIRNKARSIPGVIDLVGVVKSYKPIETVSFVRDGENQSFNKRQLVVVDDSEWSLEVDLMNTDADVDESVLDNQPVVAFKELMIKEYKGALHGSTSRGTKIDYNSTLPEAQEQKEWYEKNASTISFKSYASAGGGADSAGGALGSKATKRTTLEELAAEEEETGEIDSNRLYRVVARVHTIKREAMKKDAGAKEIPMYYLACPNCKKKAQDAAGGGYQCISCNRSCDPDPRFIHPITIQDNTCSLTLTSGHEQTERLLGTTAKAYRLAEQENENELGRLVGPLCDVLHKEFSCILRFKQETYQGDTRMKAFLQIVEPLDYAKEAKQALDEVISLMGQPKCSRAEQSRSDLKREAADDAAGGAKRVKAEAENDSMQETADG